MLFNCAKCNVSGQARCRTRCGTTVVECALTLPVLFFVLIALLDLGIAATRYNALAEVSRRIAREAILHGSLSPASSVEWGPVAYGGNMADGSQYVASAQWMIPTMRAGDVSVAITWPKNDNSPRDPVRVEVNYEHRPLIPGLCPWGPITLRSVATMHIAN